MRKIKIQDLSNRPVTNVELMTRYVFGDNYPTKFIPGDTYDVGDYVYTINDNGTITVYYCLIGGEHRVIDDYNWCVANIPAMVLRLLEEYIESGIVKINTSEIITDDDNTDEEVMVSDSFSYKTFRNPPYERQDNTFIFKLGFNYDPLYHNVTVWVNRKRISCLDNDCVVLDGRTGSIILNQMQISDDLTTADIVINVLFKTSPESRLLYNDETVPERIVVDSSVLTMYVNTLNMDMSKSCVFDLYYKGIYISELYYSFRYNTDTEQYIITLPQTTINTFGINVTDDQLSVKDFKIDFTASISSEVTILKNDISRTIVDQVNRFHLDMKYTDFANISEIHQAYGNGKLIANTDLVLYNSTAHIEDEEYYLNAGDTFIISYKNIMINSVFDNDMEETNSLTEPVIVNQIFADLKRIPLPFLDFDVDKNTLMVFNQYGYHVSSTRYYVKDNILTFYPHDESIHYEDTLTFQLLNNDYSVGSYMKTVAVTEYGMENGIKLALAGFDKKVFDLLLFTTQGMYITSDMYEVDYDKLKLKPEAPVVVDDTLEFVFFEYIKPYTNTTITLHTTRASSQTTLELPFNYLGTRDTILLFQSDGMYIDSSRYNISTSGVVTLTSGTNFKENERIDIVVSKRYEDTFVLKNVQRYK